MKFIINADDFGRTETVNCAIVEGFSNKTLDRTTAMVNMPFFDQAVLLSEKYVFKNKVGLHLNLISGQPLTDKIQKCSAFCDASACFNGKIFRNRRVFLWLTPKEKKAVRIELKAQIKKFFDAGFVLKHADSHGHIHTFPSLANLILNLLQESGFDSIRISANIKKNRIRGLYKSLLNKKFNRFNSKRNQECLYFGSFKEITSSSLEMYDDGISEIMLHPNIYEGDFVIGEALHYPDLIRWKQNLE